MTCLDRLARNDFVLYLLAKDEGYRVTFSTPGGITRHDCKTFGEACNKFAELAEEFDMVALERFE